MGILFVIQADVSNCENLNEFYFKIRTQQEIAHGHDYCKHHDAIKKCILEEDCISYKELGTHQGATAAAACLANPKILQSIELIDISFDLFDVNEHLFNSFCIQNDIIILKNKIDSSNPISAKNNVDLLLVDSVHTPNHLEKELKIHSSKIQKFMIFHDTAVNNFRLFKVLENFIKINLCWNIIEHYTNNYGYTVLKRIKY